MLCLSSISVVGSASCADRGDPPSAGCAAEADVVADVGGAARGIALAAVDDRFEPSCVELEPGVVMLVVRNDGRHPHNIRLPDGTGIAVDAGQVALLEATVGSGGLRYACTIHAGMEGELRAR